MVEADIATDIKNAPILIVDDNISNVTLLLEILRHDGYTNVRGETDPREVKALCEQQQYQLLLIDIRMPHLDGYQVIDQIRPLFDGDYPPILVLTAQTDPETRRRSLEAGARDFLTKPINSWELLHRVRNLLEVRVLYKRLDHQNRELERRVAERTRELSEALAAARKAERAKLDFLAVMSHELRTPLNAIIGFAEVIASQPSGPIGHPEYLDYLKLIEDGGVHLLSMVNNILDFTRGATATIDLDETTVELRRLLGFCIAMMLPKAQAKRIALQAEGGEPIHLRADERRLREVLLGLVDNAVKFGEPGGHVRVTLETDPEEVRIVIADDGPGIPAEIQSRIFDPFTQGEAPLGRRHDGIGLGLAIVRRYVELHGGRIDLVSTPGQGTTVQVVLPGERVVR